MSRHRGLLALLPVGVACACANSQAFDRSTEPGAQPVPTTVDVGVLDTAALSMIPGLTVLDAMRNRLPAIKIQDDPSGCPQIELRGRDAIDINASSNPLVYVDGTRSNDTCALITLPAASVRRVEIYPLGYTPRPGYAGSGHGLILIFLKRADMPDDSTMANPGI